MRTTYQTVQAVSPGVAAGVARASARQDARCRWDSPDGRPHPIVVQLWARPRDPSFMVGSQLWLSSQLSNGASGLIDQGFVRLSYGAGAVESQIEVDVRTGSFQLPPCTSVTAEMFRFNATAIPSTVPFEISVSIAPGVLGGGGQPISTEVLVALESVSGPQIIQVPAAAIAARVSLNDILPRAFSYSTSIGWFCDASIPAQFPSHGFWPVGRGLGFLVLTPTAAPAASTNVVIEWLLQP